MLFFAMYNGECNCTQACIKWNADCQHAEGLAGRTFQSRGFSQHVRQRTGIHMHVVSHSVSQSVSRRLDSKKDRNKWKVVI